MVRQHWEAASMQRDPHLVFPAGQAAHGQRQARHQAGKVSHTNDAEAEPQ